MPPVWLPGVTVVRGQNAGYAAGHNAMRRAVAHYTVGADSRGVALRGFFHFLVHRDASREGGCTQYAEIDAKTWHGYKQGQYDANSEGPGIEFERLVTGGVNNEGLSEAQPLTANQLDWGARIIAFCAEWGIPVELYNGPRYQYGNWHGWINHQALDSDRSDGLTRAEWDAMTNGEMFTVGQMEDIAQWEQDTRTVILRELVGDQPHGTEAVLAQWIWDTRAQVEEMIKDSEQRIIAAINDADK